MRRGERRSNSDYSGVCVRVRPGEDATKPAFQRLAYVIVLFLKHLEDLLEATSGRCAGGSLKRARQQALTRRKAPISGRFRSLSIPFSLVAINRIGKKKKKKKKKKKGKPCRETLPPSFSAAKMMLAGKGSLAWSKVAVRRASPLLILTAREDKNCVLLLPGRGKTLARC